MFSFNELRVYSPAGLRHYLHFSVSRIWQVTFVNYNNTSLRSQLPPTPDHTGKYSVNGIMRMREGNKTNSNTAQTWCWVCFLRAGLVCSKSKKILEMKEESSCLRQTDILLSWASVGAIYEMSLKNEDSSGEISAPAPDTAWWPRPA